MSEQGDQRKDREEPQQHGSESPNPSQGGGSEGGTGGSESGTERGGGVPRREPGAEAVKDLEQQMRSRPFFTGTCGPTNYLVDVGSP